MGRTNAICSGFTILWRLNFSKFDFTPAIPRGREKATAGNRQA